MQIRSHHAIQHMTEGGKFLAVGQTNLQEPIVGCMVPDDHVLWILFTWGPGPICVNLPAAKLLAILQVLDAPYTSWSRRDITISNPKGSRIRIQINNAPEEMMEVDIAVLTQACEKAIAN